MAIPFTSQLVTIPAPIRGQNSRDNWDMMDPTYATLVTNWVCRNDVLELRKGYSLHCDGLGGPVETLIAHCDEDGTERLLAAANTTLWNVSTTTPASLTAAPTSDRWQTTHLDGATVLCNGADTPYYYTVAAGLTATTYTGITPATAIQVCNYKGRLYYVEEDKASFWYGPDGGFASGLFTEFPVGKFLSKGGPLCWVESYSRDTGSTSSELLVAMSQNGEVLIYSGAFPGASDFSLVARFELPRPIGRRSYLKLGPDLLVITENGIFPLSSALSLGQVNLYASITDSLQRDFNRAARSYGSNFGWSGILHNFDQIGIINVPTSGTTARQFVFNPNSRAWSTFSGIDALSWALYGNQLYFGTADGCVYVMDGSLDDNGLAINSELRTAWNYLGDRAHNKSFIGFLPFIEATSTYELEVCIANNYGNTFSCARGLLDSNGDYSRWNENLWNSFQWSSGSQVYSREFGTDGDGLNVQYRLRSSTIGVAAQLYNMTVKYKRGGN